MITLKQIAQAAGVTEATASLAMRNCQRISKARRETIWKLAREMGYKRNAHVSSLMRYIRNGRCLPNKSTLAIVLAFPEEGAREKHHNVDDLCTGAEQRASEMGYRTDFFWYNDPKVSPQRLNKILLARGIQGVIIASYRSCTVQLEWSQFAVAATNYTIPDPPLHRVHGDMFMNVLQAMEKLWARGYRRVGLACGDTGADNPRTTLYAYASSAYLYFMAERTHYRFSKMIRPLIRPVWGRKLFLEWFDREKPDAVIGMDWDLANWLRARRVRVPEDVAVVLLNHSHSSLGYAGVDAQSAVIGRTAAEMVIEQLENNEFGVPKHPKVVTVSGEWMEGATIRPAV